MMVTLTDLVYSAGVFISLVCPIRMPVAFRRRQINMVLNVWNFGCCRFLSPLCVYVKSECMQCLAHLKTTCPRKFGECTLNMCMFLVTFRLACLIRVPVAFRRPQKKHLPRILEHVLYALCRCSVVTSPMTSHDVVRSLIGFI